MTQIENSTWGQIGPEELQALRAEAKPCLTCGMLATVDPISHAQRYDHPPVIADGSGKLTWSMDALSWVGEPEPEAKGNPVIEYTLTEKAEAELAEPEACGCWSCNSECGSGCGPVKLTHRGPICLRCAEMADVFDDDRTGTKATVCQDRVRLEVDTFRTFHKASTWLDLADIDALVAVLLVKRTELARQRAEYQS